MSFFTGNLILTASEIFSKGLLFSFASFRTNRGFFFTCLKERRNPFKKWPLNLWWISNKTIVEVGNTTKAATFKNFLHLSYQNTHLLFCVTVFFNISTRQTLIDDFWRWLENMNSMFTLKNIVCDDVLWRHDDFKHEVRIFFKVCSFFFNVSFLYLFSNFGGRGLRGECPRKTKTHNSSTIVSLGKLLMNFFHGNCYGVTSQ